MRKRKFFILFLILWLGCGISAQSGGLGGIAQHQISNVSSGQRLGDDSIPGSCTAFSAQENDTVLFGNNEDYSNPDTYLWVEPSSDDAYGGVYLGYQIGQPQGGINEKGLAFDGLALSPAQMNWNPDLPSAGRSTTAFWAKILRFCDSVEEAIQMSSGYNWGRTIHHQIIIADASGDSAVLGAGPDGALAITRKPPGDGTLVATNFNLANPDEDAAGYPCPRYETATAMLEKIQTKGDLSVEAIQEVLDSVHQEGSKNNTLYSNIFDLKNGVVYLYYWHQYGEVVRLDVADAISNGASITSISDLFSEPTTAAAEKEFLRYQGVIPTVGETFSLGWLVLSLICLFILVVDLVRGRNQPLVPKLVWLLPVFFTGPVGLFIYWISFRKFYHKSDGIVQKGWQALGASAVSGSGAAATFVALFAYFFYFNKEGNLGPLALLIPLTTGLLIFRAPLAAAVTESSYWVAIRKSFLIELISTMLSVGAIILLNTWIVDGLGVFYQKAIDPGNSLFWGVFSVYAFGALIANYPLHFWFAWKGKLIWPIRSAKFSERTPTLAETIQI